MWQVPYKTLRLLGALGVVVWLAGCAQSVAPTVHTPVAPATPFYAPQFVAEYRADNPLVGHFYHPERGEFYSWQQVMEMLPESGWVLLGEQHDHPDHHAMQVGLLQALADQRLLGNVAMEMLAVNQQPRLDSLMMRRDVLPSELEWNVGWPWENYQQQVAVALMWANRVLAGDLADDQKAATRRDNVIIPHYSPEHTDFLANLVVTSHCNLFPADRAGPMVKMQLARDQFMARQMNRYPVTDKVSVFIAGSGHVRADYGAPLWLADDLPRLTILLQAVGAETDARSYANERVMGKYPADLIYFVPAMPARDYCAELLESMRGG